MKHSLVRFVLCFFLFLSQSSWAQCPPTNYPIGSDSLSTAQVSSLSDADLNSELERIGQLLTRCRQYTQSLIQCYDGVPPSAIEPLKSCLNKRRADLTMLKKEILARLSGAQAGADLEADRKKVEEFKRMKSFALLLQRDSNDSRDSLLSDDSLDLDPEDFEPPKGYKLGEWAASSSK